LLRVTSSADLTRSGELSTVMHCFVACGTVRGGMQSLSAELLLLAKVLTKHLQHAAGTRTGGQHTLQLLGILLPLVSLDVSTVCSVGVRSTTGQDGSF
jgi:hypothetical protein